jgi:hypothetical protein
MWEIVGWIVWAIVVYLALTFAWGCRTYMKAGCGFQWATGVQTFYLWVIALLFVIFDWSKLHMLWVTPILFFSAQFLVLVGVPVVRPIILFATWVFLRLILIGINKPMPKRDLE